MLRENLLAALKTVSPGLAARDLLPIFSCFCFSQGRVMTYNDVVAMDYPCDLPIEGAVRGDKLMGSLTASRAREVTIKKDGDDAVFQFGRSRLKLPTMGADEFAFQFPKSKGKKAHSLDPSMIDRLAIAAVAMGLDASYPSRLGVTLADDHLYATDNFLVASVALESDGWPTVVMPPRFVELLISNRRRGPSRFYATKEYIMVEFDDGCRLFAKTVAEGDPSQFRDLFESLPEDIETFPTPKGLDRALEKAVLFLPDDDPHTRMTIVDGKFKVRTSSEAGVSAESLKVSKRHPDCEAKTSPVHLQKALAHTTDLRVSPEFSAVLLSDEEGSVSILSALVQESAEEELA